MKQQAAIEIALAGRWPEPEGSSPLSVMACVECGSRPDLMQEETGESSIPKRGGVKHDPLRLHTFMRTGALDGRWAQITEHLAICPKGHGGYYALSLWISSCRLSEEDERHVINALAIAGGPRHRCELRFAESPWDKCLAPAWPVLAAKTEAGVILEHTIPFRWPRVDWQQHGLELLILAMWPALIRMADQYVGGVPEWCTCRGFDA